MMPPTTSIPPLDARGLLPPGRYVATFDGLSAWFTDNGLAGGRAELLASLRAVCHAHLLPYAGYRLVVAGSVLSRKATPADIDVTIDLMEAPEPLRAQAEDLCGPTLCFRIGRVAVYATTQPVFRDWLVLFESVHPRKAERDLGTGRDWYWERRGLVAVQGWAATG